MPQDRDRRRALSTGTTDVRLEPLATRARASRWKGVMSQPITHGPPNGGLTHPPVRTLASVSIPVRRWAPAPRTRTHRRQSALRSAWLIHTECSLDNPAIAPDPRAHIGTSLVQRGAQNTRADSRAALVRTAGPGGRPTTTNSEMRARSWPPHHSATELRARSPAPRNPAVTGGAWQRVPQTRTRRRDIMKPG